MNLHFSPKFLADVCDQAQVLLKRSCTLGKLENTQTKGITLLCKGKNIICISCIFNGFKYTSWLSIMLGPSFCTYTFKG